MNALVKQPAALKKRKLSFKQQQQPKTALGSLGETKAAQFLSQKNLKILNTNIIVRHTEIDIIALDLITDELVFCEVKTRSTAYFGDPSLAINFKKLRKLRSAAVEYLQMYPSTKQFRIDSIAVLPNIIYHYENITF